MRFLSRKNDNMGKMKKTSIIIALAYALGIILPFSSAKAEKVQYWAKGVSEDAGWYIRQWQDDAHGILCY